MVDITPPIGYRMSGYFDERLSTGVSNPLYAKGLVLEQGGKEERCEGEKVRRQKERMKDEEVQGLRFKILRCAQDDSAECGGATYY